jgi:PKD repeat protein
MNHIGAEGEEKIFWTYVAPAVTASFGYDIDELHIAFLDSSSHALNYHWDFGDGDISTLDNPVKDYASGGMYHITLIADNIYCFDTFSTSITIDSCPKATITYSADNRNVFLYTDSTNTVSYFWDFGDGDSAMVNFPNVFHQYQRPGEYVIILKVKNRLGCEAVDTVTMVVEVTGLDEVNPFRINCYSGGCQFNLTGDNQYTLEVIDGVGNCVAKHSLQSNSLLSTSDYPSGVYLLRISNNQSSITKKIIVR